MKQPLRLEFSFKLPLNRYGKNLFIRTNSFFKQDDNYILDYFSLYPSPFFHKQLKGHTSDVTDVQLNKSYVVSRSRFEVIIWEKATGVLRTSLKTKSIVHFMFFQTRPDVIVFATNRPSLFLYDMKQDVFLQTLTNIMIPDFSQIHFLLPWREPNFIVASQNIVCYWNDSTGKIENPSYWNESTQQIEKTYRIFHFIYCICIVHDKIVLSSDGLYIGWKMKKNILWKKNKHHNDIITDIKNLNDTIFITISLNGEISLNDVENDCILNKVHCHVFMDSIFVLEMIGNYIITEYSRTLYVFHHPFLKRDQYHFQQLKKEKENETETNIFHDFYLSKSISEYLFFT